METNHHGKGPVHINVPVSEPLFGFTTAALPGVRVITRYQGLNIYDRDYNDLIDRMNKYRKRMIVVAVSYTHLTLPTKAELEISVGGGGV